MGAYSAGGYTGVVRSAVAQAGAVAWVLAGACVLVPFSVQFVLHPADMARLIRFVGHLTAMSAEDGEIAAVFTLGFAIVVIYRALVAFHRRSGIAVALWPVAGIAGFFANLGWWYGCGFFDPVGALAGFAPLAAVNFAERIAMSNVYGRASSSYDAMFGD